MTFTPSATSSFSAGAVFWGMVWIVVFKLDELVSCLESRTPSIKEDPDVG